MNQPGDSGLPKMVGTAVIALFITLVAFILLAIFAYGVKKFCSSSRVAVPRQNGRSWSDLQLTRGQDMTQPSNTSVVSIALATTGQLRPPPPAYHNPYTYPPEYQTPFSVAGNMEKGGM